jgi:hypothetical protein
MYPIAGYGTCYGTGGADTSVLLSLLFVQHFVLFLSSDNYAFTKFEYV